MALVMSAEPESAKLSEKRSSKTCVFGNFIFERLVIYQYIYFTSEYYLIDMRKQTSK